MTTRDAGALRIGVDLSIERHGLSGSRRWANGLVTALQMRSDTVVRPWLGPPRRSWRNPARKFVNAAQERYFYEWWLPSVARRWRADVLMMPVNMTARRTAIPQVVSILDLNFLSEPDAYDSWFRRYATRMFARAARDAAIVTTISEFSQQQIAEWLGIPAERIHVVYPGLDAPLLRPGPPPIPEEYALFVGVTEPHKNVDLLLDAWSGNQAPPLRLVITGKPGRAHASITERAARLGGRVIVTGQVSDVELESWYAGARIFLFPSLAEGFGYPPLEAMQRGIPVISSNVASMPEVLGDAALYHGPRDVATLLSHISAMTTNGQLREQFQAAGRKRSAAFTWLATADRMMDLLRSAAQSAA